MQKSVLLEIIRSLDKKEIRELNKWLQSPAHNQRQDVVKLFEFLVKNLPNGDESAEKTRAWKYVFPGQPFDDAYLRQVMYFLLKAIEDYLVFAELSKNHVDHQLILTRIYRKRKLEKPFNQAQREGLKMLEDQPLRNDTYYLNTFFFAQVEYEHRMAISQNGPVNLQETADALEKWFVEERLRISKDMIAHHQIFQKIHYDHGLLDETLGYAEKKGMLNEPAIAVYYYAYKAFTNPTEEAYFENFEKLIQSHSSRFQASEIRTLYLAALNYCVPKVNQGRQDFYRKAYELYKKGVETGILMENGELSRYTFLNTVSSALKVSEFEWAELFIHQFKDFLEEKHRSGTANFSLSRLYFEKGEYAKAQHFLTQFEYDDMLQNIVAKTMLLKIYFETDEYDAFESLLESLRTYLQRKEALDSTRKASYKNMISLMKKLLQLNIYSKVQREVFRELVAKTNPLAERDWFLRQLDRK